LAVVAEQKHQKRAEKCQYMPSAPRGDPGKIACPGNVCGDACAYDDDGNPMFACQMVRIKGDREHRSSMIPDLKIRDIDPMMVPSGALFNARTA